MATCMPPLHVSLWMCALPWMKAEQTRNGPLNHVEQEATTDFKSIGQKDAPGGHVQHLKCVTGLHCCSSVPILQQESWFSSGACRCC
ncbi:interferon epsilon isoform X3 [Pteropus medius]|uniref:interferon epsilon isoform X3 n=1 Tax=Pteropus vampyrus TaxID=132908 RepID=UPI00196A494A|nr:interferon epsilon isoform X3 [Pteropus giganteus]